MRVERHRDLVEDRVPRRAGGAARTRRRRVRATPTESRSAPLSSLSRPSPDSLPLRVRATLRVDDAASSRPRVAARGSRGCARRVCGRSGPARCGALRLRGAAHVGWARSRGRALCVAPDLDARRVHARVLLHERPTGGGGWSSTTHHAERSRARRRSPARCGATPARAGARDPQLGIGSRGEAGAAGPDSRRRSAGRGDRRCRGRCAGAGVRSRLGDGSAGGHGETIARPHLVRGPSCIRRGRPARASPAAGREEGARARASVRGGRRPLAAPGDRADPREAARGLAAVQPHRECVDDEPAQRAGPRARDRVVRRPLRA